jgi:hypothetical protein
MSAFGVCMRCVRKQNINWTLGIDRFNPKSGIIINIIFSCGETIERSCFLSLLLARWQVVLYTLLEPRVSWMAIKKNMENQDDNCCWNLQWDVGHAIMDKVSIISPLFPSLPCPGDRLLRKDKLKNVTHSCFEFIFCISFWCYPTRKGRTRLAIKIWMDFSESWRSTWMTMDFLTHLPIRGGWRDAEIEILEEPAKIL